jgi:hypothetical protein
MMKAIYFQVQFLPRDHPSMYNTSRGNDTIKIGIHENTHLASACLFQQVSRSFKPNLFIPLIW